MYTLNVVYHCKPGLRQAFLKAIEEQNIVALSLADPGALRYAYYTSVADPDEVLLVEEWESRAQQEAHVQGEAVARVKALKEGFVLSSSIARFGE